MFVHLLKCRLLTPSHNTTSFQSCGRRRSENRKGTKTCISLLFFCFIHHHPLLQLFLHYTDFRSSFLSPKRHLPAEPPLLHSNHQGASWRRGAAGRDATESPPHSAHTTSAPSSPTPSLPKPQLLLLILEMSLFSKHWDSYRLTSGEWKHWFCVDLAPAAHLWESESGSVSTHWAKENLFWYCNCKNWHVNMNDHTCLQLLICASR